jgi:nicotinamidase-related amidase
MYSAFSGTGGRLHSYLSEQSVEHLVVTGVYSTGCVNATICEAFHLGYRLSIVKDCVATFDRTRSQDYQKILIQDWEHMYGELISSQKVMAWGN